MPKIRAGELLRIWDGIYPGHPDAPPVTLLVADVIVPGPGMPDLAVAMVRGHVLDRDGTVLDHACLTVPADCPRADDVRPYRQVSVPASDGLPAAEARSWIGGSAGLTGGPRAL